MRNKISATYSHDAAITAAEKFSQTEIFQQSQHIAAYLPVKNEFNSLPLIEKIWYAKKQCYLPCITENKTLQFVHYVYGDPLRANQYSILEPSRQAVMIAPAELDLVIVPLLAFDKSGGRLGTGGGYYDRTFAFLHETLAKKPLLVGLAYSIQQTEHLPLDPWDIKLNAVVTEEGLVVL